MFFRPLADGDAGRIARSQFKQLAVVCGCSPDPQPDEFKGKLFALELVQQKNNPEYTNIRSIKPADEFVAQPAPAVQASAQPAATPAATQAMPLGSTAPAANNDEPDWL